MTESVLNSLSAFHPELALVVTLCVLVVADLMLKEKGHATGWILLAGLGVTGVFVLLQIGREESIFFDMIAVDAFALFAKVLLVISGGIVVLFSIKSRELESVISRIGEYYMLLAGMMTGMFLMVGASNLLIMYLAFELTSICSYVLAGFTRKSVKSAEASMKYIIYGAVSSGILLYGISLLAGIAGTVSLYGIQDALAGGVDQPLALSVSFLMIMTGIGFKIAVTPFHFWAPDVYEGAPLPVAALLAVASKIAAFAMLVRLFRVSFLELAGPESSGIWQMAGELNWHFLLAVMAALAMTAGNLAALWQENIKRLLAYSSIAHAGYILMGLAVLTDEGTVAILIYLIVYLFMNLGAFYMAMLFSNRLGSELIEDYKGLGYRAPLESIAMTVFLIALAGFPPTAGFIAKLYIFGAAVSAGWIWLAVIAGVTTVISLFYYIRVVRNMFLLPPGGDSDSFAADAGSRFVLMLLLIPTLLFGIWFSPVLEFARRSLSMFGV